ncbi:MAG TPA: dihydrofolate reductase [Steroidobacteraceae bacterium]|jgi:dihydrofolate reductase|nr:dihydrofolate reductase [Steroidobacteraceae bacterium]
MEIIVAVSENDVIGRRNQLPWRLSADLKRFKALTLGHPVLMGRKTYESIGKALPGRLNLILSRDAAFAPPDCTVASTLEAARRAAGGDARLMVIGGAQIFRVCMPFVSRIHLTLVHARVDDGDTFFDAWRGPEWRESSRESHQADERNSSAYSFVTLERFGIGAS